MADDDDDDVWCGHKQKEKREEDVSE